MGLSSGIIQEKNTYRASNTFVTALLATDIFTITGSATKTINITKIGISATQTTSSIVNMNILKRSTANSGGTSSILSSVPLDSKNSAATAVVLSYTANPTLGTLVGSLKNTKLVIPIILVGGQVSSQTELILHFDDLHSQSIVLRGVNEVLAINLSGITIVGNSFSIWIQWTEE